MINVGHWVTSWQHDNAHINVADQGSSSDVRVALWGSYWCQSLVFQEEKSIMRLLCHNFHTLAERTGVASQVGLLFDNKSVRKIILWKMSRVGFKYSCQSSHLYIMPVKRGYKIDGRDQTSEEKQQVWQFFFQFYLQFEIWRNSWSWGEKWVIICQYQADPASQPTIS